jgi:DNA-binding beta-propeller fold protein YncE
VSAGSVRPAAVRAALLVCLSLGVLAVALGVPGPGLGGGSVALAGARSAVVAPRGVVAQVSPREATAGSSATHHYEYVFPHTGEMYVYDMDNAQQLVQHVTGLPDTDGIRGVMVSPSTHVLYLSHGGDGSGNGNGSLLAYDLVSGSPLWNRHYNFPIDSGAISPDGKTIYMPSGELDPSGVWNVLNASNGDRIGSIQGGTGAHNTIVSLDGKYVFLGGRASNYLRVASTATNQVVRSIGPLVGTVRPFTVNGTDTLAYTTATDFLGFQVSSITNGKVLYTVPIPGFSVPSGFPLTAPSHGISLTPDEKQIYVFDAPSGYVHVFDVSRVPAGPPVLLANIKLSSIAGNEEGCAYDCPRDGWLQASRDGRFVYVGDSGDVIDTHTRTIVANLHPLAQTRQMLEVDWANGLPVATTSRYGLGYATQGPPTASQHSSQPEISALALSPRVFVAAAHGAAIARRGAARGTTVSYNDSQPASTRFTVLVPRPGVKRGRICAKPPRGKSSRPGTPCIRYLAVGGFAHRDRAGRNEFRFSGRIGGRKLARGTYRLQAQPVLGGRAGKVRAVSFRVIG